MTAPAPPLRREPLLNLPPVISGLLAVLVLIQAVRALLLWPRQDMELLLQFSFIPARYAAIAEGIDFPGGVAAEFWTPVTYGLLHGDWVHLTVNGVWLAAFGSALAWRFGAARFLAFSLLATLGGALAHYLAHADDIAPMVGASGAISGHMAAVSRFMFQQRGPLAGIGRDPQTRFRVPAVPLSGILSDRRVLGFLAIWFLINLLAGTGSLALPGEDAVVAWEAHVGGCLVGLLTFDLFDPLRGAAPPAPPAHDRPPLYPDVPPDDLREDPRGDAWTDPDDPRLRPRREP